MLNLKFINNNFKDKIKWLDQINVKQNVFFVYSYKPLYDNYNFNKYRTSKLISIFFLKKEIYYTKLKYSRVPQFDTSSGAAASFTSGFYGFLICEKFGFELLDSGDFFFMVIYISIMVILLSNIVSILNNKVTDLFNVFITIFRSFK